VAEYIIVSNFNNISKKDRSQTRLKLNVEKLVKLAKRNGNSKAVFAGASKLLKVVYWVMKEKKMFVIDPLIIIVKVITMRQLLKESFLKKLRYPLTRMKTAMRSRLEWIYSSTVKSIYF
jgi:hypothetical protein